MFSPKPIQKYLFCSVLALPLVACNIEQSSSNKERTGLRPVYNANAIGNCTDSPLTGDVSSLDSAQAAFVDSGYFAKEFRKVSFKEAMRSSSLNVINWLYDQGVSVLKVETQSKAECRYFGFLNRANGDLLAIWENYGGQNNVNGQQVLLGLFRTLLQRPSGGGPAQMLNPTILLRDDTDRWTLLHEKTHFLFTQGRIQNPNMPFIETLRDENRQLYRKLRTQEYEYIKQKRSALAEEILITFSDYLNVNQEMFQRGPLEEFTIESLISTQVIEGKTYGLEPVQGLLNALAYMNGNAEPVLNSYQLLVRKLQDYQKDFFKEEPSAILDKTKELETLLQQQIDFIENKILKLETHLESIGERSLIKPRQIFDHSHYDLDILKEQIEMIDSLDLSHTSDSHNTFNF